jgi:hypothetical protein
MAWVKAWPVCVDIVNRSASAKSFAGSRKRWIVERPREGKRYRRPSQHDELLP